MTLSPGAGGIRFLRQYGPIPRNDNMYDEQIWKSARRAGIRPLAFTHPVEAEVLALFRPETGRPVLGYPHRHGRRRKEPPLQKSLGAPLAAMTPTGRKTTYTTSASWKLGGARLLFM